VKATMILGMELNEVSAKVRTGPPGDDEEDYALPIWAGVVPMSQVPGSAIECPRLPQGLQLSADPTDFINRLRKA
jgi:uncharacterized protein